MGLIDKDALKAKAERIIGIDGSSEAWRILSEIDHAEEIDAEPVRHGHWQITEAYPHNVYCSECHTKFAQTHWTVWEDGSLPRHYCPHCGARMDGVRDDINK